MTQSRPMPLAPALIGGAVAGVLSAIPFLNCLCCLWILGGAMLAVHLLAKDSPAPIRPGDGAVAGALTGVVAAVVNSFIGLPLRAVNAEFFRRFLQRLAEFSDQMPSNWESWMQGSGRFSPAWFLVGLMISAAIFAVLGALGGLLGASLFGRRAVPPPPAPPVPPVPPAL